MVLPLAKIFCVTRDCTSSINAGRLVYPAYPQEKGAEVWGNFPTRERFEAKPTPGRRWQPIPGTRRVFFGSLRQIHEQHTRPNGQKHILFCIPFPPCA